MYNAWVMFVGIRSINEALDMQGRNVNALGLLVDGNDSRSDFISSKRARYIANCLSRNSKSAPSFRMIAQQERQKASFFSPMDRFCEIVLVTHELNVHNIMHLAEFIGVTTVQIVSNISCDDIRLIQKNLPYIKIIKSIPVIDFSSCARHVKKYMHIADAIELDTFDIATNKFGGTGKTHNWSISQRIVQEYGREVPIILAGGLDHENVEEAIQTVKPFGVDVSSGIMDKKNGGIQFEKVDTFMTKVKKCRMQMRVNEPEIILR